MPLTTLQTEWAVGDALTVIREAGAGGSATVHEATTASGVRVALKIGHDTSATAVLAAEARLGLVGHHAGMPALLWCGWVVLDALAARVATPGVDGARPALAMEWVDAEPLGARGVAE